MPFRQVNRAGFPGHDPGLQRHHLLPRQLLRIAGLARMLDRIGITRVGFDDFRRNGLLLPASEQAAKILGLPLHRGPHRSYNGMVIERVGLIEQSWSHDRLRREDLARDSALFRLRLLQQALRRRLLRGLPRRIALNARDPAFSTDAFAELDGMADQLWRDVVQPELAD